MKTGLRRAVEIAATVVRAYEKRGRAGKSRAVAARRILRLLEVELARCL